MRRVADVHRGNLYYPVAVLVQTGGLEVEDDDARDLRRLLLLLLLLLLAVGGGRGDDDVRGFEV